MSVKVKYLFAIAGALALAFGSVGCDNKPKKSVQQTTDYVFRVPNVPPTLQGELAMEYARRHIWDGFDFQDTLQLERLDKRMLTQAFAYYVGMVRSTDAEEPMQDLMRRAATSKPMLEYFIGLAEFILHDPNSPLRDDEKYIPVLEFVLSSPLLDEYEKMPYASDLHIAKQNRVGCVANDFIYTMADGSKRRMSKCEADYILIFISNPGCPMCRDVRQQIEASELLSEMVRQGSVKILVIYPDEDLAAWRESLPEYPADWINGYDADQRISRDRLYDLRAIPALYLLDREKRVLAKDCTDVGYIEELILNSQGL